LHKAVTLSSLYALPFYDFDLRASHARTLLPAALASVPFGFVLVRVRVRHKESGSFGLECACCLYFGLSFAMAIHSLNSLEIGWFGGRYCFFNAVVIGPLGGVVALLLVAVHQAGYRTAHVPNPQVPIDY